FFDDDAARAALARQAGRRQRARFAALVKDRSIVGLGEEHDHPCLVAAVRTQPGQLVHLVRHLDKSRQRHAIAPRRLAYSAGRCSRTSRRSAMSSNWTPSVATVRMVRLAAIRTGHGAPSSVAALTRTCAAVAAAPARRPTLCARMWPRKELMRARKSCSRRRR